MKVKIQIFYFNLTEAFPINPILELPEDVYDQLLLQIGHFFKRNDKYTLRLLTCKDAFHLPNLCFAVDGDKMIKIPSDKYIMQHAGRCILRIIKTTAKYTIRLGNAAYKSHCMVFDSKNKVIKFGLNKT